MDDRGLQHPLEDVLSILKQQPSRLLSEFAFLGPAVSTCVKVLYIFNLNIYLLQINKPHVLDWLQKTGNKWKALPFIW